MRYHSAFADIADDAKGAAIALGNFDGVHRGHQAVIASAREAASALGRPLGVAVFEPHPRRFFYPDTPPFRLQRQSQRARVLEALGVDCVYEVGFDAETARMSDEEFAGEVLQRRLGAAHVSVGAEFRFGRGRIGDVERLAALGQRLGFGVSPVAPIGESGAKFSSSAIRAAIEAGEMQTAAHTSQPSIDSFPCQRPYRSHITPSGGVQIPSLCAKGDEH